MAPLPPARAPLGRLTLSQRSEQTTPQHVRRTRARECERSPPLDAHFAARAVQLVAEGTRAAARAAVRQRG